MEPCWNLGGTLVKPWWNLGEEPWWNLLAAQDGSAPENHRESESYSAPETFTMAEDPKAIAVGEKGHGNIEI